MLYHFCACTCIHTTYNSYYTFLLLSLLLYQHKIEIIISRGGPPMKTKQSAYRCYSYNRIVRLAPRRLLTWLHTCNFRPWKKSAWNTELWIANVHGWNSRESTLLLESSGINWVAIFSKAWDRLFLSLTLSADDSTSKDALSHLLLQTRFPRHTILGIRFLLKKFYSVSAMPRLISRVIDVQRLCNSFSIASTVVLLVVAIAVRADFLFGLWLYLLVSL